MDSPGYRIAISDTAFAFDGAYRIPKSLSIADRAAYGLRSCATRNLPGGFAGALHAAANAGQISTTHTIRLGKRCLPNYKSCVPSLPGRRKPFELPDKTCRPFAMNAGKRCLPYYKASHKAASFVSFATIRAAIGDLAIHAVALRGRVFVGVRRNA